MAAPHSIPDPERDACDALAAARRAARQRALAARAGCDRVAAGAALPAGRIAVGCDRTAQQMDAAQQVDQMPTGRFNGLLDAVATEHGIFVPVRG